MHFNEYQFRAEATALSNIKNDLNYLGLGLGESGEVQGKIKKGLRDGVLDLDGIKKELGDVLWYIAVLSKALGFTLEEVAKANIDKLEDRKQRGVIGGSGDNR